jgi:hypothetical protein
MEDICDIIEAIVSQIDTSIEGKNIGPGVAEFCNTKWVREDVYKELVRTTDGETWQITSVTPNEQIEAVYVGTTVPEPDFEGVFNLRTPYWITGTRIAANNEYRMAGNNLTEKTPIIWMLELISEVFYGRENPLERTSTLRLFFLDETNSKDYYTKDHRKYVVNPMQRLMDEFIKVIENDSSFQKLDDYTVKTFARFGVETEQGVVENILDVNLSGVSLEFTLERYKTNCKC